MQSKTLFLNKKIKELTVKEFIGLLDNWSEQQKDTETRLQEDWLKGYKELARYLNCSKTKVYRMIRDYEDSDSIRKIGGVYYFNKKGIMELVSNVNSCSTSKMKSRNVAG